MGDVLEGILGGEGEVELYEREDSGSDVGSPPQDRRRERGSRGNSPETGYVLESVDEEAATEEAGEEERPLPAAERKFRQVALPEELVQPVPPFCPVPKAPRIVPGDIGFWGYLPHITVAAALEEARQLGINLGSDAFDRSQEEARQRAEEQRQKELERQLEAAKPAPPSRYFVVFATPADLEQSLQTQKWPIRNPLTEKALNAALLENGPLVLVFLSREGFQGHAALVSLVDEEGDDDFLSTWYTIAWGTRAVLPTQEAASYIDPLPAEGVMLDQKVGTSLCEALDTIYDNHASISEAPRGDSRSGDRGRRWGSSDARRAQHRSPSTRGHPARTAHLRYSGEVSMEEARAKGTEQPQRQDRRHDHQRADERPRHTGRDFQQHQQDPEFRPPAPEEDVRRRMSELARNGRRTEGGQRSRNRRTPRYSDWTDDPPSQ